MFKTKTRAPELERESRDARAFGTAQEFSYRFRRENAPADVIMAFQPRTGAWLQRLTDAGYSPKDITADELTTAHVRHLVGATGPRGGFSLFK